MSQKREAAEKALMWANRAEEYAKHWPNPSSTDYKHLFAASDMAVMWSRVYEVIEAAERPPRTEYGSLL